VVAQRDNNPILTIEGFRMAGFCLARVGERAAALERGQCAMNVAKALPPDAVPMTTTGNCIVDMLRVLDEPRVAQMQRIKLQLKRSREQIRQQAEQRGAELSAQNHPDALAITEREQAQQLSGAQARADESLQANISTAAADFLAWVHQGDALLGPAWLATNDLALPPTYVPPQDEGGQA
jgi:hypothetical protein